MIPRAIEQAMNRPVTEAELHEALEGPISEAEQHEVAALHDWFTTRYPSAEERLAYVRQAYARWRATVTRSS
jgi:hypothetical protein